MIVLKHLLDLDSRQQHTSFITVQPKGFLSEGSEVQSQRSEVKMNKRRHQRIEVHNHNLVANLSNGVASFSGHVCDVSRFGMLLADIPAELNSQGAKLSVVVSVNGREFKMLVVPKWVSGNNAEKRMGLVILDAPLAWTMFVMSYEPKDEDIWAATTHLPDC